MGVQQVRHQSPQRALHLRPFHSLQPPQQHLVTQQTDYPQQQQQQQQQSPGLIKQQQWQPKKQHYKQQQQDEQLQRDIQEQWGAHADQAPAPLSTGEVVGVGRLRLRMGQAIGEGAYARVWAAQGEGSHPEVAVKEMRCGQGAGILPDASLQRARFEVKVMQLMSSEAEDGSIGSEEIRVPKLLDHQFWDLAPTEPGAYLCRVAMTRRRGQALVSWLQERRSKKAEALSLPVGLDAATAYCNSFLNAAAAAREMLLQLTPTFAKLNGSIAVHRDVNARNLLVFCPSDSDPTEQTCGAGPSDAASLQFSLVDFGSSIDAKAWTGSGEGSWELENPTGDARYWGPASWLRFLRGAEVLSQEAGLCRQYSRRLDVFALAICSLEVIAKLHTAEFAGKASTEKQGDLITAISRMQTSWWTYWSLAVSSFEKLAEYSQLVCLGQQQRANEAWQDLSHDDIPRKLRALLHELCSDLFSLAELCRQSRELGHEDEEANAWAEVGDALEAIREMVHEDSSSGWQELASCLRSRRQEGESPVATRIEGFPAVRSLVPPFDSRRSLAEAANLAFSSATSHGGSCGSTDPGVPRQLGAIMIDSQANLRDDLQQESQGWHAQEARQTAPWQDDQDAVRTPPVALQVPYDRREGEVSRAPAGEGMLAVVTVAASPGNGTEAPQSTSARATSPIPLRPNLAAVQAAARAAAATRAAASPLAQRPGAEAVPVPLLAGISSSGGAVTPRTGHGSMQLSAMQHRSSSPLASPQIPRYAPQSPPSWTGFCRTPPPGPVPHPRPSPTAGLVQGNPGSGQSGDVENQQALHVLRQVEAEVRQLKQWYTDAIQAMRQPNVSGYPMPGTATSPPGYRKTVPGKGSDGQVIVEQPSASRELGR